MCVYLLYYIFSAIIYHVTMLEYIYECMVSSFGKFHSFEAFGKSTSPRVFPEAQGMIPRFESSQNASSIMSTPD